MKERWKQILKLGDLNLIQFVPMIFVVSLVANSVLGYQEPRVEAPVITKEIKAESSEEENKESADEAQESSTQKAEKLADVEESGTYKDGTYTGSGQGWGGTTKVSVTIKNKKIASVKILSHEDTPSYFNRAKSAVLSAIVKKQSTNVDAVSGATMSSNGIIKAVRNALSKAAVNQTDTTEKETTTETTRETTEEKKDTSLQLDGSYKNGTYKGSGEGYRGGTTTLAVTVKKNRITRIKTVSHEDTPSFFAQAKTLFETIIAKQTPEVDVVSGATMSSNGIIDAVKAALAKAEIREESTKEDKTEQTTEETTEDSTEESVGIYKDGTYTGDSICETDDYSFDAYSIQLDVIVQNGKITEIGNLVYGDTYIAEDDEWYMERALNGTPSIPGILQQVMEKQTHEADAVSGATCSSNALIEAIGKALTGAK